MPDNKGTSVATNNDTSPVGDFKLLPLDYIISAPLTGAVNAQRLAAEATRDYIKSFLQKKDDTGNYVVDSIVFDLETDQGIKGTKKTTIKAPLLSIVPTPHLRIDSITTNFRYAISQTSSYVKTLDVGGDGSANAGNNIANFIGISLNGHVSSQSKEESLMNRSGSLEITVHASEAPMPEGLARILSILAESVTVNPLENQTTAG
jgi:hypothetical protein